MNTDLSDATSLRSARVRLFFDQTSEEHFLVLSEVLSSEEPAIASQFSVQTFLHEDNFLERLIAADLPIDDTSLLAGTAIRVANQRGKVRNWVELSLTEGQMAMLGLDYERLVTQNEITSVEDPLTEPLSLDVAESASQFYQFLMQSPTPFVMLSGPEHRFTFINQPYVDLIGKTSIQEVLMKPVREVLPELEGQPFFQWLDEVYKAGVKRVGKEQLAHIRRHSSEGFEDRYFDFIYYPVRNMKGKIYGVMVQAADVTEKVQGEAVSDHREESLFRQWAELDSIYRTAPVGMALLDGKTLRLLRVNEKQAEMMGMPVAELLGKEALELTLIPAELRKLFERVALGETVRNAVMEKTYKVNDAGHRTWLVNISPFLGASGEVLAFTSISLQIPDEP